MNTTSSAPIRDTTVTIYIDRIGGSGPFHFGARESPGGPFLVAVTADVVAYSAGANDRSSFRAPALLLDGFSLLTAIHFHPTVDPSSGEIAS